MEASRKTSPAWLTDVKNKLSIIGSGDLFNISKRSRSSSGQRSSTSSDRSSLSRFPETYKPVVTDLAAMSEERPLAADGLKQAPASKAGVEKSAENSNPSVIVGCEDTDPNENGSLSEPLTEVDLQSPSPESSATPKRSDSPFPESQNGSLPDTPDNATAPWLQDMDNAHIDTLDLQHFGPWQGLVPVGRRGDAKGHDFLETSLLNPTWCDKCGDFVWGFSRIAVRCSREFVARLFNVFFAHYRILIMSNSQVSVVR